MKRVIGIDEMEGERDRGRERERARERDLEKKRKRQRKLRRREWMVREIGGREDKTETGLDRGRVGGDRKSTRLNSSHL